MTSHDSRDSGGPMIGAAGRARAVQRSASLPQLPSLGADCAHLIPREASVSSLTAAHPSPDRSTGVRRRLATEGDVDADNTLLGVNGDSPC